MKADENSDCEGPWGATRSRADNADRELANHVSEHLRRSKIELRAYATIGLLLLGILWITRESSTAYWAVLVIGGSIAGIVHGQQGVLKTTLAGKIASHISATGRSTALIRRWQLGYLRLQLGSTLLMCVGLYRLVVIIAGQA